MKKAILILIWILIGFSSQGFAEETIRITTGEWSPYSSEDLKYHGIVSLIITEAFALEGVKVEFGFFPWGRAVDYAKEGDWDASSLWFRHPDREKYFYHSDHIIKIQEVFFHLKSFKFDWDDWKDIESLEVGATIGYTITKVLKEKQKTVNFYLETVPSDEINLRKILKGNIQILPLPIEVGYEILRKKFSSEEAQRITYHPKPINKGDSNIHLLFSKKVKKNLHMLKLFNKGLKRLRENGKYDQFISGVRSGDYIIKK
jgi:polar amino acid transport system substrate-binding protein